MAIRTRYSSILDVTICRYSILNIISRSAAVFETLYTQDATRIANETRKELNKMWKLLEVGLDGIYCPLLLLNKKKYAALSVTERDGVVTKVRREQEVYSTIDWKRS